MGLKVLGQGEWKVRKHGADKRRVWRKVHLVIDADSHEVRAVEMTDHRHGDGEIVPGLLARLPEGERLGMISGDGTYDTRGVYEASAACKADLVVPPRRNGKPWEARTAGASATRRFASSGISDGGSGSAGAATTAAVWPRRPCHASSGSMSASRPAPPLVRSRKFRSAAPFSAPSTPLVCPTPSHAPDQTAEGTSTFSVGIMQQGRLRPGPRSAAVPLRHERASKLCPTVLGAASRSIS
ncbi:transposase [Roseomonas xinghualingensis]|uniref:transposase n=1 Tax=Roseomonas xinghualingensis TaxID=2986475 RepID=UPI00366C3136